MKYLPLIWAGLWRKKVRTILTLLSIAVAFILFGVLQGVNAGFGSAAESAHLNRLSSTNMGYGPLPIAALPQIEAVPGVTGVSFFGSPLVGTYQRPGNTVFGFPVDLERFLGVYPEIQLARDQRAAFLATRTGVVIGVDLAKKYGLKVGDRLPITTQILRKDGTTDWVLDIVGIFSEPDQHFLEGGFFINYAYFDEVRATDSGTVVQFQSSIQDPSDATAVGASIDKLFENSSYQTRTLTEREEAESRISSLGDINYITNAMVAAAFFALLFLTGNTITQSVRERTGEFAVLKTVGFSNNAVAVIVVTEAMILCTVGAAIGLGIAALLYPAVAQTLPGIRHLAGWVVAAGAVVALIVALISSLPQALRVNRLQIVDALAGR